ncbi:MAG TPA: radical SAM protein [Clostridiales bacterium]|nr:radical SAM protein [Clostridiales bacterium]
MSKAHYIIPIFVPHQGCPFHCVFCNQRKISGANGCIDIEQTAINIEKYLKTIRKPYEQHVEIAFYGGSFTGIDPCIQKELLTLAYQWKKTGMIRDIRISTRPDYIDKWIMEFLQEYGVSIIELGVQSMDDEVLNASGRGHTSQEVKKAVQLIRQFQVQIGLQLMLGLPKDNLSKAESSAEECIRLKPDFVRIYPTLVIKDTPLESMWREGRYHPLSLEEAIAMSKRILLKFVKNDIPVIRIGLQPTENILEGKDVISGPFHPAFRQCVEAQIYRDMLEKVCQDYGIYGIKKVEIEIHDRYLSSLVGIRRSNIEFLSQKYKIAAIRILRNNSPRNTEFRLNIGRDMKIHYDMKKYAEHVM